MGVKKSVKKVAKKSAKKVSKTAKKTKNSAKSVAKTAGDAVKGAAKIVAIPIKLLGWIGKGNTTGRLLVVAGTGVAIVGGTLYVIKQGGPLAVARRLTR